MLKYWRNAIFGCPFAFVRSSVPKFSYLTRDADSAVSFSLRSYIFLEGEGGYTGHKSAMFFLSHLEIDISGTVSEA